MKHHPTAEAIVTSCATLAAPLLLANVLTATCYFLTRVPEQLREVEGEKTLQKLTYSETAWLTSTPCVAVTAATTAKAKSAVNTVRAILVGCEC